MAELEFNHKCDRREHRFLARKNTDYAECIRVDDDDTVRVDLHPEDSAELRSFLRAFDLHFQYGKRGSGELQLTFGGGTTVNQVHVALTEFDRLSRPRHA
jgi:hypothetical protein